MDELSGAQEQRESLHVYRNIVGGRAVDALDGRTLEVTCPSDGLPFALIPRSGAADVDAAVGAARRALEGDWGRLDATQRGRLLSRLGAVILEHVEDLGSLESRDTGKPLTQGRADMVATARYFEFYGGAADKLHGETIPFLDGYTVAVTREPHGVTGHIVPWNYPAQIIGRSVGAALACGNACVVKPAEDACLSVLAIAALALEVGFPLGAFNVVAGLGSEAGAALAGHPGVDFVSFTGSPEVGTLIQTAAAQNHAGCTLELGGKSPQILFEDADIEAALPIVVRAIIQNGGQTCSAGSRVLVQNDLYVTVAALLSDRFRNLRAAAHDMDLDLGAMIHARQRQRVEQFIARARAADISVLAEGQIEPGTPVGGHYVRPILFGPVPPDSELAQSEVFGPVLSLIPFADETEAVRIANGTPYGLVAGIWTRDAKRSMRVARAMRCGQVFVNGYGARGGIELPFGGFGRSGHSREKGFEGLKAFSTTRTIVINHG